MSAKKKKQANSPLRIVIILILLGLLAYKYQLFDGKLLENNEPYQKLGLGLNYLERAVKEMKAFSAALSKGDLSGL